MTKRPNSATFPPTLEPELLLAAYASGYFPMAESREGRIHWYSPDPRAILPLESFKVSRSLRQVMSRQAFNVRIDSAFETVIRACADREDTWISDEIVQSYLELHRLGFAHSVESWKDDRLAGGLYGVALGGAFFGESMFSWAPNASKVALVHLVERLKDRKFELLDTQFVTLHLARFGVIEIPRDQYLQRLARAIRKQCSFVN